MTAVHASLIIRDAQGRELEREDTRQVDALLTGLAERWARIQHVVLQNHWSVVIELKGGDLQ
jgi:hypothetical protein